MLISQFWPTGSGGPPPDSVHLTDRIVTRTRLNADCHSGIRLGSNGVLSTIQNDGGFSQVTGQWLVVGDPASFWVRHTIVNGTLQTEPAALWNPMDVTYIYENLSTVPDSPKVTEVFFEIAEDAGGVSIVESATMEFSSERIGGTS